MRDGIVRVLESIVDGAVIQRFCLRLDNESMLELMEKLEYCSESTQKRWVEAYAKMVS